MRVDTGLRARLRATRGRRAGLAAGALAAVVVSAFTGIAPVAASEHAAPVTQTNLVSDLPNTAQVTDPNLVNPWGLVHGPTTPWWVSDNGMGVSTLYNGSGQPFPPGSPLVVTIPPPNGGTPPAAPTGVVFNGTPDFVVSSGGKSGPALFIFATEDGTISGWNATVDLHNAILKVDNSMVPTADSGAVYKGLALVHNDDGNFLAATNFRAGTVDVFDSGFHQVTWKNAFTDDDLPAGYAPFNIAAIGDKVYVTYALQNDAKHDDVAGAGHGFVDVYSNEGRLLHRLISRGALDSPWGLAVAPEEFGSFGGDLLVGNFGDGQINAYEELPSGQFVHRGQLRSSDGRPLSIDGLWALQFGHGALANNGPTNTLFFTAGPNDESNGLFGSITSP